MGIQPHLLGSVDNYWTEMGDHFKKTEGFTPDKGEIVYPDSLGVPTFGMGYALLIKDHGVWKVRAKYKQPSIQH